MVVHLGFRRRPTPVCAHCGRLDLGNREAIRVVLGDGRAVCRPRVAGRMNCYGLVTTYHHQTPCRLCRSMFPIAGPPDATVWSHGT